MIISTQERKTGENAQTIGAYLSLASQEKSVPIALKKDAAK